MLSAGGALSDLHSSEVTKASPYLKQEAKIAKGKMDQMQKSHYQKACIVITGDVLEDWRYVFRELRMRVGVSSSNIDDAKFE